MGSRTFTIVTFNILVDMTYWEERRPLILKGLQDVQPDLVCLQEVNIPSNVHMWLSDKLEMPHVHLTPRTGAEGRMEGNAILSRLPFESKDWLDLETQHRVAQRVEICIDHQPVFISNAHYFFEPGASSERFAQIQRVFDWLPKDKPAIMCGDFNANPDTPSIQFLKRHFDSAYESVHGKEPGGTVSLKMDHGLDHAVFAVAELINQYHPMKIKRYLGGMLDYIMISKQLQAKEAEVILDQPAEDDDEMYPSDHYGLMARLELK